VDSRVPAGFNKDSPSQVAADLSIGTQLTGSPETTSPAAVPLRCAHFFDRAHVGPCCAARSDSDSDSLELVRARRALWLIQITVQLLR